MTTEKQKEDKKEARAAAPGDLPPPPFFRFVTFFTALSGNVSEAPGKSDAAPAKT